MAGPQGLPKSHVLAGVLCLIFLVRSSISYNYLDPDVPLVPQHKIHLYTGDNSDRGIKTHRYHGDTGDSDRDTKKQLYPGDTGDKDIKSHLYPGNNGDRDIKSHIYPGDIGDRDVKTHIIYPGETGDRDTKTSHHEKYNYNGKRIKPILREKEYFDLTYTFDNSTIFYPNQRFDFHHFPDIGPTWNLTRNGKYRFSYASFSFCMAEHGGTHIDAPFHFNRYGWRLHEIPMQRMMDVPGVVIDVERHVFSLRNPQQFRLQVEHIEEHEARHGTIPAESLVLIHFGWGRFWNDRVRYMGWENSTIGGPLTLLHPAVSGRAANFLLRERNIVGLGTDTISPDATDGGDLVAHILLLESQVYIIENVGYLSEMVRKIRSPYNYPDGCDLRLTALPIKTEGTGGPLRLVGHCRN